MTKKIADSLGNILKNDVVKASFDRAYDISQIWPEISSAWSVDILARRPSPCFKEVDEELEFVDSSDLGLHTWLSAVAERKGVISISGYKHSRPRVTRSDQVVISSDIRTGNLSSIVANSKSHAHAVKFKDNQIIQKTVGGGQKLGAWRNFMVVNDAGELYNGWDSLSFLPTEEELKFMIDYKQTDASGLIAINKWVHDNMAFAFMGSRYISTAIFEQRITEEKLFYKNLERHLRADKVHLPGGCAKLGFVYIKNDEGGSLKVDVLEAKVVVNGDDNISSLMKGEYPILGKTAEGIIYNVDFEEADYKEKVDVLRFARDKRKAADRYQGFVTSAKRTVELAAKKWIDNRGSLPNVGWNVPEWNSEKLKPRSRNVYNTMDFGDVKLAYRVRPVSVTVSVK